MSAEVLSDRIDDSCICIDDSDDDECEIISCRRRRSSSSSSEIIYVGCSPTKKSRKKRKQSLKKSDCAKTAEGTSLHISDGSENYFNSDQVWSDISSIIKNDSCIQPKAENTQKSSFSATASSPSSSDEEDTRIRSSQEHIETVKLMSNKMMNNQPSPTSTNSSTSWFASSSTSSDSDENNDEFLLSLFTEDSLFGNNKATTKPTINSVLPADTCEAALHLKETESKPSSTTSHRRINSDGDVSTDKYSGMSQLALVKTDLENLLNKCNSLKVNFNCHAGTSVLSSNDITSEPSALSTAHFATICNNDDSNSKVPNAENFDQSLTKSSRNCMPIKITLRKAESESLSKRKNSSSGKRKRADSTFALPSDVSHYKVVDSTVCSDLLGSVSEQNVTEVNSSSNGMAEQNDSMIFRDSVTKSLCLHDNNIVSDILDGDDDDVQMISHTLPRKRSSMSKMCFATDEDREQSGCASCFSMFPRQSMVACAFGHYSCIKCLEYQIKSLVSQTTKDTLKCFMARCNNEYPIGELRRFLPPLVLDILEEKNRAGFKDNSTELKNSEPVQQAYVNSMPAYWTPMDESADALEFIQVPLSNMSREFDDVAGMFMKTMHSHCPCIVSIKRVQNKHLWEFYAIKKKQMERENGGKDVLELQLFHGTSKSAIQPICRENFDWRISGVHGTAYGQGSYFARDASYSHGYTDYRKGHISSRSRNNVFSNLIASPINIMPGNPLNLNIPLPVSNLFMPPLAHSGIQISSSSNYIRGGLRLNTTLSQTMPGMITVAPTNQSSHCDWSNTCVMFLVRALVGNYCVGNSSFRRPPPINPMDPQSKYFDTCVDNVQNPSIYVIFEKAQCYPEYIIEYEVNC